MLEVKTKFEKVFVEKIQVKKRDVSSVNVPMKTSNLQIIELNTEDKKRMKRFAEEETKVKKEDSKPKVALKSVSSEEGKEKK